MKRNLTTNDTLKCHFTDILSKIQDNFDTVEYGETQKKLSTIFGSKFTTMIKLTQETQ